MCKGCLLCQTSVTLHLSQLGEKVDEIVSRHLSQTPGCKFSNVHVRVPVYKGKNSPKQNSRVMAMKHEYQSNDRNDGN